MRKIYFKNYLFFIFLLVVTGGVFSQFQKAFSATQFSDSGRIAGLYVSEPCDQPVNVGVDYEMGMPTAEVSWNGNLPQEGWLLLYGPENTIDINGFLSDPENYENPEVNIERVHSSPHNLYMNMLYPSPYEIFVVSDCGDGLLLISDKVIFEMGERAEEVIGEGCDIPFNVTGVQNDSHSIDLSWESQDGGLYQIAWGPFGIEMNDDFFNDPQTGSVIVSDNPYHLEFPRPGAEEPHSVFIRKFCGGNSFSEWTVPQCFPPDEIDSQVNETQVILNWTPVGHEFAWQVAYGPQGINPYDEGNPNLNIANVYETPSLTLLLSNLEQGITYDFYIRANCSGSDFSEWTGPGSFNTVFLPCNPVEDIHAYHITHQSADIIWTPQSSEHQWDITYGLAPLDIEQSTTITVNNNAKVILTGLQSSSVYEVFVTAKCASGETAQGETISFTTTESDDVYCIPYFLNGCTYDFIDHLILDGENDTRLYDLNTGCTDSNYNNRTDEVVDFAPGNQYFTRVSHGNFPISGDNLAIWIDFDDNGTFDEFERVGDGALASGGFTNVNFTIPEDANPGQHRMRIMLAFNAYPSQLTPCNDGESIATTGEVHDYTANILSLQNCDNTTAGMTIADFVVCPGEDFSISAMGSSEPAYGLERKWQSSPAGQNNWTDIAGGLLPAATVYGGIQQATDFRYVVTCIQSGENSISNILHVTMSNDCYCKPEANCGGPGGLQINNVTLVGETISLNNQTGCTGYGDYTIKFAPDLKQGETYTLSVTANNANLNDDKIKVWIDFNENRTFESQEVIMDFPGGLPGYTVTSEFTVPANVTPGLYRMRARIGWWGSPTLEGCSPLGFGETEDYLVEVIPGEVSGDCPQPSGISVQQENDPAAATVSWLPGGNESRWELVYVLEGSDPNNEEPVIVNDNPGVLINDLEPDTDYDVYVRAVCNENNMSEWTGPVTFRTGSLSIEDLSFQGFTYFPVPAGDKLSLRSPMLIEEVIMLDMSGQKVLIFSPLSKNSELDISRLSSGIYFMKVRLKEKSRIFKIIKK